MGGWPFVDGRRQVCVVSGRGCIRPAMEQLSAEIELFDQQIPERSAFERMVQANGFLYWWASDLMQMLEYESWPAFNKAVQKAMTVCISLGIDSLENIRPEHRDIRGKPSHDYKLSRFGCYLVVMNGDPKKPRVAQAQAYFAGLAAACQEYIEHTEAVERVNVRAEISEHEKSLAGAAKRAGVTDYGLFQNSGYRGMYNMNLSALRRIKGVPEKRSPLDFMGSEEMAANLFRVKMTELKIKNEGIRGQAKSEVAAEMVGREVRATVLRTAGVPPEALPSAVDLQTVKSTLKQSQRHMKKLDKKPSV